MKNPKTVKSNKFKLLLVILSLSMMIFYSGCSEQSSVSNTNTNTNTNANTTKATALCSQPEINNPLFDCPSGERVTFEITPPNSTSVPKIRLNGNNVDLPTPRAGSTPTVPPDVTYSVKDGKHIFSLIVDGDKRVFISYLSLPPGSGDFVLRILDKNDKLITPAYTIIESSDNEPVSQSYRLRVKQ